jgi:hypothetical protein
MKEGMQWAGPVEESVTRGFFKSIFLQFILVVVSLVVTEGVLRGIDLRYLRIVVPRNEVASIFQFDSRRGWSPTPNAISTFPCNLRTITVQNNSLGRAADLQAPPSCRRCGRDIIALRFCVLPERCTCRAVAYSG